MSSSNSNSRCKHHKHSTTTLHNTQKITFILPIMLCSRPPPAMDICYSHEVSPSLAHDPLSPKIGCAGQLRRSNKVLGFSTVSAATATTAKRKLDFASASLSRRSFSRRSSTTTRYEIVNYHKLNRFFSSKSITNNVKCNKLRRFFSCKSFAKTSSHHPTSASVDAVDRSADRFSKPKGVEVKDSVCAKERRSNLKLMINVADLDPPLPVTRKKDQQHGDSLWKRRSGGAALQSLENFSADAMELFSTLQQQTANENVEARRRASCFNSF